MLGSFEVPQRPCEPLPIEVVNVQGSPGLLAYVTYNGIPP
jgi:hypothetical protein